jgi:hypothetical protein
LKENLSGIPNPFSGKNLFENKIHLEQPKTLKIEIIFHQRNGESVKFH